MMFVPTIMMALESSSPKLNSVALVEGLQLTTCTLLLTRTLDSWEDQMNSLCATFPCVWTESYEEIFKGNIEIGDRHIIFKFNSF